MPLGFLTRREAAAEPGSVRREPAAGHGSGAERSLEEVPLGFLTRR